MSEPIFTLAKLKQRIADVKLFTVRGLAAEGIDHTVHLNKDEWSDLLADPEVVDALERTQRFAGGALMHLRYEGVTIFPPNGVDKSA